MAEYEVKVPDSLKAKGPKLGRPRKVTTEQDTPVASAQAPKVVLDSGKRRVRLRGADYALPCCVSQRGKEIRVVLQPDRWTEVPEEIYQMLKSKFQRPVEREVPDWRDGDDPRRTPRMETADHPIIEGL